jgi:hypothetical protein
MKWAQDDAQTNIDFLFGLAIFLIGFLYVFTFIPGLFIPYQASAIDLSSVAYKTGAVLVEDPGWYIYSAMNGSQMGNPAWETQPLNRLARIGLADDKYTPNVLSREKILGLNGIGNYTIIRDKIGLNGSITYDFGLSLIMNDTLAGRQVQMINITSPLKGDSIEYMERNVLVNMGAELFTDCYDPITPSGLLRVNIADMKSSDTRNVTLRVYNASGAGTVERLMWQTDPLDVPVPMVYKSEYIVRKNGVDVPVLPVAFGPGDIVEIVVYNDAIRVLDAKYLWVVSVANVFPGSEINYYEDPKYKLKNVCYPGVFKIEVWPNEGI